MGIRTAVEGALSAARQGGAERAGRPPRHWLGVGALTALAAAGYTAFALLLYYTFQTSSYDLVIFDQAVRSYAHFEPGISIIKGVHNGFGPHFSVLGDHWSPILAALAPLYWIYNGPQVLLVAQAVLFALAIPPIWVFTRRAFGGGSKATAAAYLVAAAYALSWPIASALDFDFHEVAFAPLLIAVALERLQAGKLRSALIALAILLLVKEDMGLLVAGIGLYLAVARPRTVTRQGLVGGILIAAGVADSVIATYVLIPAFGGRSNYYWAYTALGHNVPQAAWHLLTHPAAADVLVTPRVKLYTMLWLFGAFCFLSLRSPIVLATIPLLLERMLANLFPDWWVTAYQYNAYLVVILVCAAVDGAARFDRAWQARRAWSAEGPPGTGTVALSCAAAMCAVAVALVPHFAFGSALRPSFYHRDAQENAAAAADAVVPAGVTVQAVDNLGPQLSARDTVLLWDGDGSTPPLGSSWIVANVSQRQFTFHGLREQKRRLALLERNDYQVVFSRDGYIVLHRGGSRPGAAGSKGG